MNQNKMEKSMSGITLIALVITIIVLLILATVSIATLTGQNGILTQAQMVDKKSEEETEIEKILLAYSSSEIDELGNEDTIKAENVEKELRKIENSDSIEVTLFENLDRITGLKVWYKDTNHFYFIRQGKVEKVDENYFAKKIAIRYIGGSLLYKKDLTKVNMRFGYMFTLPEEWSIDEISISFEWSTHETFENSKIVEGKKFESVDSRTYKENLVINNIPISGHYDSNIYVRAKAEYTGEETENVVITSVTDVCSQSVKGIVDDILANPENYDTEEYKYSEYAQKLKDTYDL